MQLVAPVESGDMATWDHIVPKFRGGNPHHLSNRVLACRDCNINKSHLSREEYVVVQRMRGWDPDVYLRWRYQTGYY